MKPFFCSISMLMHILPVALFSQDITSNLVGHWKFNNSLADASTNNNAASPTGAISYVTGAEGLANGALLLDDVTDYVTIPHISAYDFGTGDFSLCVWVKYSTALNNNELSVLWYTNAFPGGEISLGINAPKMINARTIAGQNVFYTATLNDNNWHQIVFTRSGTTQNIYVDGTLGISATRPLNSVNNGLPTNVGENPPGAPNFTYTYYGALDNYRLYGRALSALDVATLYGFELVLPVELLNFEALSFLDKINLTWQTASETNASHFIVEHSSDGENFRNIAEVTAHGTTPEPHSYQFFHPDPLPGDNYYRLQMVDYDGSFEYSKIAHVRVGKEPNGIRISPNPTEATSAFFSMRSPTTS